jgi:hypothetical protein
MRCRLKIVVNVVMTRLARFSSNMGGGISWGIVFLRLYRRLGNVFGRSEPDNCARQATPMLPGGPEQLPVCAADFAFVAIPQ